MHFDSVDQGKITSDKQAISKSGIKLPLITMKPGKSGVTHTPGIPGGAG
jgi:hypothetical protein